MATSDNEPRSICFGFQNRTRAPHTRRGTFRLRLIFLGVSAFFPSEETSFEFRMAGEERQIVAKFSEISLCAGDELIRDFRTPWGKFTVAVQGDPRKAPLLTVHDVGLNYSTNFKPFFNLPEVKLLVETFCVYHVNVPGQESDCQTVTVCPDLMNLILGIEYILRDCGIRSFVGMGYGAGAYVLSMFALRNPDVVNGLILLNATADAASWTDYGYFTMAAVALKSSGLTQSPLDFLRWYHCGCLNENVETSDLVQSFDQRLFVQNPENLANWMFSYMKRKSLELERGSDGDKDSRSNFRCPVLMIVGKDSPHVEQTRKMSAACDPRFATLLEIPDCRVPLDENPMKVDIS